MKKYVYHNSQELSDIIKDIKLGTEPNYVIYNAEGRRLKYDFTNNSALLLVTDNQVPDTNPFYKEPAPVIEDVVVEEEAPIDDAEEEVSDEEVDEESFDEEEATEEEVVEEEEPELAEGDEVQLPDGTDLVVDKVTADEIVAHEAGAPDPEIPEELNADLDNSNEEVEKSELDSLREENARLKGDLSIMESELDMKDSRIDELNRQVESCKKDLYSAEEKLHYFENISTDDLVEMLKVRGYSVTLNK